MMLDHPGNRSNAFGVQTAEPLIPFPPSLPISVAINIPQWNCCHGNMAYVLHLIGDTECKDFMVSPNAALT